MNLNTISIHIGLFMLIIINIVLGSFCALFERRFHPRLFFKGVIKGLILITCFYGTYFVGYINPKIIAFSVNGTNMDVLTALDMVVLASYYFYAKQVIEKLTKILNGKECGLGDNSLSQKSLEQKVREPELIPLVLENCERN